MSRVCWKQQSEWSAICHITYNPSRGAHYSKIYNEQFRVDSDSAGRAEHGYIDLSARWAWHFRLEIWNSSPKCHIFSYDVHFLATEATEIFSMDLNASQNLKRLHDDFVLIEILKIKVCHKWVVITLFSKKYQKLGESSILYIFGQTYIHNYQYNHDWGHWEISNPWLHLHWYTKYCCQRKGIQNWLIVSVQGES